MPPDSRHLPRGSGGPRRSVRFSQAEHDLIVRSASVAGISVGSMIRVCAVSWAPFVAAEMKASGRNFGRVRAANRPRPFEEPLPAGRRAGRVLCGADPSAVCGSPEECVARGCRSALS